MIRNDAHRPVLPSTVDEINRPTTNRRYFHHFTRSIILAILLSSTAVDYCFEFSFKSEQMVHLMLRNTLAHAKSESELQDSLTTVLFTLASKHAAALRLCIPVYTVLDCWQRMSRRRWWKAENRSLAKCWAVIHPAINHAATHQFCLTESDHYNLLRVISKPYLPSLNLITRNYGCNFIDVRTGTILFFTVTPNTVFVTTLVCKNLITVLSMFITFTTTKTATTKTLYFSISDPIRYSKAK